jgi:hypothetical protein
MSANPTHDVAQSTPFNFLVQAVRLIDVKKEANANEVQEVEPTERVNKHGK